MPLAATLSPRVISMSSMSKSYGLPGLRVGWAVSNDPDTFERLLAAKEQVVICGATLDEAIAARVLAGRDRILPAIRADVADRLAIVRAWMAGQDVFEWVEPKGGVVGLVRARPGVDFDAAKFHHTLLHEFGTYVGAGPLVRTRRPLLPARFRLAHPRRAPCRTRRPVRPALAS